MQSKRTIGLGLLLVLASCAGAWSQGATLTVGGAGAGFTTIQAAVDHASEGDTIVVHAGTYREHVTIERPLALQADGNVVVDAGKKGSAVTLPARASPLPVSRSAMPARREPRPGCWCWATATRSAACGRPPATGASSCRSGAAMRSPTARRRTTGMTASPCSARRRRPRDAQYARRQSARRHLARGGAFGR